MESLKSQEKVSATMLLESQILYRLGRMDACLNIYQALQKSRIDSLEINLVAGLVSAGRASDVQGTLEALRIKATSSFELAYNTSCSLIEINKYSDAEQLLLSARRWFKILLSEVDSNKHNALLYLLFACHFLAWLWDCLYGVTINYKLVDCLVTWISGWNHVDNFHLKIICGSYLLRTTIFWITSEHAQIIVGY